MSDYLIDASVFIAMRDSDDRNHEAAYELLGESDHSLATIDLARYEVMNVAVASWGRPEESALLLALIETLGGDGGVLVPPMEIFVGASQLAAVHKISGYDATYAATSKHLGRQLVSCDERDLVSKGLAILPSQAI